MTACTLLLPRSPFYDKQRPDAELGATNSSANENNINEVFDVGFDVGIGDVAYSAYEKDELKKCFQSLGAGNQQPK